MRWDLGNMRIGTQMAISVLVILIFMGIAIFQYHVALQKVDENYSKLIHITSSIKDHAALVTDYLQQASIGEKEFRIKPDLEKAKEVADLLKTAEGELEDLEVFEQTMNDTAAIAETRKLKEMVVSLQKEFQSLKNYYETRGLNDDSGMMGRMRNAAHAMEEQFLRVESLAMQNHYLTMRRHEKDYLLRLDIKYYEKLKETSKLLRSDISDGGFSTEEKNTLVTLMDSYLRTMDGLIAEEDRLKVANQSLDAAHVKVVNGLHMKEKAGSQLMERIDQETSQAVQSDQNKAMFTSVLAVLIALVASGYFVYSIRKRLFGVASSLSASAAQIAAAINQQDRISNLQASSVNETNTTMEELGSSSRQSSEQAESAAFSAQKALEAAEHGMSRVEDMVQGMSVTKSKVDAIAQQILRLSEQTSQISAITGTVTDFANETKMLAMNAAVEAVRAGEHGKGFSVLAVEIRKLAEESKRSAERINSLVSEIQRATNSTVMATEEGGKTVDQGMMVAQNTAEAFAEVSEAVNNASQSSQQISLNVRQQAVAIKQVVEAMKSINTGAKETAAGISQVKSGTQVLNEAAQQLKSMV